MQSTSSQELYQARGKNELSDVFLQHRAVLRELLHKHCIALRSPPNPRKRNIERHRPLSDSPCKLPKLGEIGRILFDQNVGNRGPCTKHRFLLLKNSDEDESTTTRTWRRVQSIRDINGFSDSDFVVAPFKTIGKDELLLEIPCVSAEGDVFYDSIASHSAQGDSRNHSDITISEDFHDCSQYAYVDPFPCNNSPVEYPVNHITDAIPTHPSHKEVSETITPVTFFTPERDNRLPMADPDGINVANSSTVVPSPNTSTESNESPYFLSDSQATPKMAGRNDPSGEIISDVPESPTQIPGQGADGTLITSALSSEKSTDLVTEEVSSTENRIANSGGSPTRCDMDGSLLHAAKKSSGPQSSLEFLKNKPTCSADAEVEGAASFDLRANPVVLQDESTDVAGENPNVDYTLSTVPLRESSNEFLSELSDGMDNRRCQDDDTNPEKFRPPEEIPTITDEKTSSVMTKESASSEVVDIAPCKDIVSGETELHSTVDAGDIVENSEGSTASFLVTETTPSEVFDIAPCEAAGSIQIESQSPLPAEEAGELIEGIAPNSFFTEAPSPEFSGSRGMGFPTTVGAADIADVATTPDETESQPTVANEGITKTGQRTMPAFLVADSTSSEIAEVPPCEAADLGETQSDTRPGDLHDNLAPETPAIVTSMPEEEANTPSNFHDVAIKGSIVDVNDAVAVNAESDRAFYSAGVDATVDAKSASENNVGTLSVVQADEESELHSIVGAAETGVEAIDHPGTSGVGRAVSHNTLADEQGSSASASCKSDNVSADLAGGSVPGALENNLEWDDYAPKALVDEVDHASPSSHMASEGDGVMPDGVWAQLAAESDFVLDQRGQDSSPHLGFEVPDNIIDVPHPPELDSHVAMNGALAHITNVSHRTTGVPDNRVLPPVMLDRVADVAPGETLTQPPSTNSCRGEGSSANLTVQPDKVIYVPGTCDDMAADLGDQTINPENSDLSTVDPIASAKARPAGGSSHRLDESVDTKRSEVHQSLETMNYLPNHAPKDGCTDLTSMHDSIDCLVVADLDSAQIVDDCVVASQDTNRAEVKLVENSSASTKTDFETSSNPKHVTNRAEENQADRAEEDQGGRPLDSVNHSLNSSDMQLSQVMAISTLEGSGEEGLSRQSDNLRSSQNQLLLPRLGISNDACRSPSAVQFDATEEGPVSEKSLMSRNGSDPKKLDAGSSKQWETPHTPPRPPTSTPPNVPIFQRPIPSGGSLDDKWNQCTDMWTKLTVEKAVDGGCIASDLSPMTWMSGSSESHHDEHKFETPPLEAYSPLPSTPRHRDLLGSELYVETRSHLQPSPTPPRDFRSTSPYSTPGRATGSTASSRAKVQSSPHRIESTARRRSKTNGSPSPSSFNAPILRTSERAKQRKPLDESSSPHRILRSSTNGSPSPSPFNAPVLRTSERAKQRKIRDESSSPHRVLSSRPQFSPSSRSPVAGPSPPPAVVRSTKAFQSALRTPSPSAIPTPGSNYSSSKPPPSGRMTKIPTFRTPPANKISSSGETKSLPSQKSGNGRGPASSESGTRANMSRKSDLARKLGSVERPALRKHLGDVESRSCSKAFIFNKHQTMGPCYRCWSFASSEEQAKFLARGSHLCIVRTRGGCAENCKVFPSEEGEPAVRLCRKCFCATHASNDRLQVYRGNHVKVMPKS